MAVGMTLNGIEAWIARLDSLNRRSNHLILYIVSQLNLCVLYTHNLATFNHKIGNCNIARILTILANVNTIYRAIHRVVAVATSNPIVLGRHLRKAHIHIVAHMREEHHEIGHITDALAHIICCSAVIRKAEILVGLLTTKGSAIAVRSHHTDKGNIHTLNG